MRMSALLFVVGTEHRESPGRPGRQIRRDLHYFTHHHHTSLLGPTDLPPRQKQEERQTIAPPHQHILCSELQDRGKFWAG